MSGEVSKGDVIAKNALKVTVLKNNADSHSTEFYGSEMTKEEHENLEKLIDLYPQANEDDSMDFEYEAVTLDDIDNGAIPLEISHAGGEYEEIKQAFIQHVTGKRYV